MTIHEYAEKLVTTKSCIDVIACEDNNWNVEEIVGEMSSILSEKPVQDTFRILARRICELQAENEKLREDVQYWKDIAFDMSDHAGVDLEDGELIY